MGSWGRAGWILMAIVSALFVVGGAVMAVSATSAQDRLMPLAGIAFFGSALLIAVVKLRQSRSWLGSTAADFPDRTIVFRRTPAQTAVWIVIFAGMAISGGLMLFAEPDSIKTQVAAWIIIAAGVAGPIGFLLRPVRLTLSPDGLDYSGFKIGPIAWGDILGVELKPNALGQFVALRIRNQEKYFSRGFPSGLRAIAWDDAPFRIDAQQLGAPALEIADAIALRVSRMPTKRPSLEAASGEFHPRKTIK